MSNEFSGEEKQERKGIWCLQFNLFIFEFLKRCRIHQSFHLPKRHLIERSWYSRSFIFLSRFGPNNETNVTGAWPIFVQIDFYNSYFTRFKKYNWPFLNFLRLSSVNFCYFFQQQLLIIFIQYFLHFLSTNQRSALRFFFLQNLGIYGE